MKSILKIIFIALITCNLLSCEEVIPLELNTAPPRLVVEGNLDFSATDTRAPLHIKLSLTTNYYDKEIPLVHHAEVWVETENGIKYPFLEQNNSGIYTSNDVEKNFIQNEYTLYVKHDNDVYEAKGLLIPTPEIIDIVQTKETFFGKEVYLLKLHYQDRVREDSPLNYYYTNLQRNNEKPELSLQSNEFSKNNIIESIFLDSDFKVNDEIKIDLHQVSRNYNDYLHLIFNAINNGGGPFQTPIAKIKGNIKNTTTPDKEALGYFRVTEKRTITHTILE